LLGYPASLQLGKGVNPAVGKVLQVNEVTYSIKQRADVKIWNAQIGYGCFFGFLIPDVSTSIAIGSFAKSNQGQPQEKGTCHFGSVEALANLAKPKHIRTAAKKKST